MACATRRASGAPKKVGSTVKTTSRVPEALAQHDRQAAEHEGEKMHHALEAGGLLRDVEWGAIDDGLAGILFCAVELAAIVFADAPCGVVRRCGDDADFVATLGEPGCHLAGVFADACELGSVVDAVDQDSHFMAV